MKKILRMALRRIGYDIRRSRNGSESESRDKPLGAYHSAIFTLIALKGKINVCIIGANDGKVNDPLYPIVKHALTSRTRVILIEPQKVLIPILESNYDFHDEKTICNSAIGAGPSLKLYSIREEYWPRMQPKYALGWPLYRAPTGITSTAYDNVARWAKSFLGPGENVEDAIEETIVPASSLGDVLNSHGIDLSIDLLQVDAEGFDDEVLFNCSLAIIQPSVILYESKHLPDSRLKKLSEYLSVHGYVSHPVQSNTLCIRDSELVKRTRMGYLW